MLPMEEKATQALSKNEAGSASIMPLGRLKSILSLGAGLSISVLALLVDGEVRIALTTIVLTFFSLSIFRGLVKMLYGVSERSQKGTEDKPPLHLLIIAAVFLPAATRHAALGDMEEIYRKDVERMGSRAAKWLMTKDILCSIAPSLKGLTRSLLIIALKAIGIYELYRRFIGK